MYDEIMPVEFPFVLFFLFVKVEVLEYPELGMEAVWKIEVENFPAFIVVDGKGAPHVDTVHDESIETGHLII